MVEFFQTSKGMDLERLTSATLMKLEEIKERTATGKEHLTGGKASNIIEYFFQNFVCWLLAK